MSVTSEFGRSLGDCLEFLESAATEGAESWAASLHAARTHSRADLCEGARRVLDAAEGDDPRRRIVFRSEVEAQRFEELHDHLASICRVILGR